MILKNINSYLIPILQPFQQTKFYLQYLSFGSIDEQKINMPVSPLLELNRIFEKNQWNQNPFWEDVLSNAVDLLNNIGENQRALILELIAKYKWMSMNDIHKGLVNALKSIEDGKLMKCKRVFVFPIRNPKDQNKVKSGDAVLYSIKGVKPFLKQYDHITVLERSKYEDINEENFKPLESDLIFLVDDYLGSGDTFNTTLDAVLLNKYIKLEQLNVIVVAAQLNGIESVKKRGVPIYYDYISTRGISDNFETHVASTKINLMVEIENLILRAGVFSLGYEKSEALITLTRTPNNTFPVFWMDYKVKGRKFKAPFPRY